jgi:hypothetical protein
MTTVNDPKGEAGAKKAPMWLLPPVALEQTAWALKEGSEKYGPWNWRLTGVCASTYVSAIMRHLNAWRDGEDNDPDLPAVSHIAKIAACCNILMDAAACGTLQDDRNKRPTSSFLERFIAEFDEVMANTTDEELVESFREMGCDVEIVPPADCDLGTPVSDVVEREADDHLTHVAAYMEDAGLQLQRAYAEKILSTEDPWLKLTKQPTLGQIKIDDEFVDLPPVPEGYDRWVDRGWGWKSDGRVLFAVSLGPLDTWAVVDEEDETTGSSGCYYIEAVKDTPPAGRFSDIKPGDKVGGLFVKDTMPFSGAVANVVDIRGTKLFQFLDRASITEGEIYSITRL